MDLNVLKYKKSVPSPAFVLWVDISSALVTGWESTPPLVLRVTWHDVGRKKCCRWWISAKENGHNALMSGFQWRKSLCSLHLKRRSYSVIFFLVLFFLAKDRSPELQLFRKKADKTKGLVSNLRLIPHRLSGVWSEIGSQVLSRPSWDGHFGGVAISDLICKCNITQEGRWNFTAPSAWPARPGTMGSHLWDQ